MVIIRLIRGGAFTLGIVVSLGALAAASYWGINRTWAVKTISAQVTSTSPDGKSSSASRIELEIGYLNGSIGGPHACIQRRVEQKCDPIPLSSATPLDPQQADCKALGQNAICQRISVELNHDESLSLDGAEQVGRLDERVPFYILGAILDGQSVPLESEKFPPGPYAWLPLGDGRRLTFPQHQPGQLSKVGNLSEPLAANIADADQIIGDAIICAQVFSLAFVLIAMGLLEARLLRRCYLPPEHPKKIDGIVSRIASGELEPVNARTELEGLIQRSTSRPAIDTDVEAVLRASLVDHQRGGRMPVESIDVHLDALRDRIAQSRSTAIVETIAILAPSVGFLGTVIGLTAAFASMSGFELGGDGGFARAMMTALVTTALGLTIRVIAVVVLKTVHFHQEHLLARVRLFALCWCETYARMSEQGEA